MSRARRLFACLTLMLGVAVIVSSYSLGKTFVKYDLGPDVYPRMLGYIIAGLSLIIIAKPAAEDEQGLAGSVFNKEFFLHLGMMVLYCFILKPCGFIVASCLVMIPMIWIMGLRKVWEDILISFATATVLYVVFAKVLSVPLPQGIVHFV